jgi:hypothetical protein
MSALYAALLGWAVALSGYNAPPDATELEIVKVSHAYLIEHACGGRECKVLGFYPVGRGTRLYIDERLDVDGDTFAASIVVHEMVHYLQGQSGKFQTAQNCEEAIAQEKEAYLAQQQFLTAYGMHYPLHIVLSTMTCSEGT